MNRGRAVVQQPELSPIRSLTRGELHILTERRPVVNIQSLRDNHHRIARAVASGISNSEVAALCGINYNRVSILKSDPAFRDLVAHYRGMLATEWAETADTVTEFLGSIRTKSLAMAEEKLERAAENDELLPTRELIALAELGLDRTGYGKVNKNVNFNVDFAANLESARARSSRAREVVGRSVPQSAPAIATSLSMSGPNQFRRRI